MLWRQFCFFYLFFLFLIFGDFFGDTFGLRWGYTFFSCLFLFFWFCLISLFSVFLLLAFFFSCVCFWQNLNGLSFSRRIPCIFSVLRALYGNVSEAGECWDTFEFSICVFSFLILFLLWQASCMCPKATTYWCPRWSIVGWRGSLRSPVACLICFCVTLSICFFCVKCRRINRRIFI